MLSQGVISQVKYCGGFSRGVPPLPIPNREVKPVRADGTDTPVGRVGRCRSSGSPIVERQSDSFFLCCVNTTSSLVYSILTLILALILALTLTLTLTLILINSLSHSFIPLHSPATISPIFTSHQFLLRSPVAFSTLFVVQSLLATTLNDEMPSFCC